MKVKVKALVDGAEKEIEVELDDAKYITREKHDLVIKETVKKRLSRQAASLMQDEEFVAEVLKSKGVDPKNPKGASSGDNKDVAAAIEKAQGEWRKAELEPVQQKLAGYEKELGETRDSQLISALESAFLTGADGLRVKKGVARKLAELEAKSGKFGWDPEHKYHALREGEEFAYAGTVTKERPYAGVEEFAATFVKNKDYTDFVERTAQNGPGVSNGNGNGGGGGGSLGGVRSRADFKSDADKSKWISENGFSAFASLPDK